MKRPQLSTKKLSRNNPGDRLSSEWFTKCETQEEKEELDKVLRNSKIQFRELKRILEHRFDVLDKDDIDLDSPNWERRVIRNAAQRKTLADIYKLLPMT